MDHLRPSLKLSWRVGVGYAEDDDCFARLRRWIRDYPSLVDEIALFESFTHHLYIPLDQYRERCAMLQRRMGQLREWGIASVGINVLTTIGHTNEAWDYLEPLPFQPMVGHDGQVSRGCACPNAPEQRAYVREKYRLTAQTGPDFIWVDDDIRIHHHGVPWPCFCPTCLGLFGPRTGEAWTREALVAALDDPARGDLRAAWVEFNCSTLESLLADVRRAVHEADPKIELGLMTAGATWSAYSGPDHARWYGALGATKSRPGGGFYSDDPRTAMIGKMIDVGHQRAMVPAQVTDCQYELENFPYQKLGKAARTVANECTMALAMGLNGIAHNWLHMWGTSDEDTAPLLREAARWRRVWETLVEWTAGLPTMGLWPAGSIHIAARRELRPGETWFSGVYAHSAELYALIGMPLAVDRPACGTILRGRMAEAFDDDELREMLSGGLILDTAALEVLEQRGLGALCGACIAERRDNGLLERFTADELNGPYVGERRDARIEFWGDARGQADVLEPVAEGARVLAVLEDYMHGEHGPCMTAFENELGGRVVVSGYAPWMFLGSAAKREQLLNVADWVTRGMLPVRVLGDEGVTPIVRLDTARQKGAVVLLNWSLEPIESLAFELRLPVTRARLVTPEGERAWEPTAHTEGMTVVIWHLPPMPAWTTACLLLG